MVVNGLKALAKSVAATKHHGAAGVVLGNQLHQEKRVRPLFPGFWLQDFPAIV
jgi:hypothetical protein